jgi:hypothetical protein
VTVSNPNSQLPNVARPVRVCAPSRVCLAGPLMQRRTTHAATGLEFWTWPPWNPTIVVRAAADAAGIAAAVRRLIRRTHGEVPVTRVEAVRDTLQEAVASLPDHAGSGVCGVGGAPGNTGNLWSGSVGHHAANARDRHPPSDGGSHSKIMRTVLAKTASRSGGLRGSVRDRPGDCVRGESCARAPVMTLKYE